MRAVRLSALVVLALAVLTVLGLGRSDAGYTIEFGPGNVYAHVGLIDKQTGSGVRKHDDKGGELDAGVFLGAVTETSADGKLGDITILGYEEAINRDFVIRRDAPADPAVVGISLRADLNGTLTANPDAVPFRVFADVAAKAEIVRGGLVVMQVPFADSSKGRRMVNVKESDSKNRNLSVDVTYTLRLRLETAAYSEVTADGATAAKSDFLNSLQGTVAVAAVPEP
ncbi:MAG: hypothetical protein K2X87_14125, partial [Gemmataceae bacterium]|nr:hypothetical protein [Gemmataceae bacterium]